MSVWKSLHHLARRASGDRRVLRSLLRSRPRLLVEPLEDRLCLDGFSVVATGLNNPRGLHFGPDGNLYVAEGGTEVPPENGYSTVGQADQVAPPIGPYIGSYTGRISLVTSIGIRATVADNLPSSQTQPMPAPLVSGIADVAFVGNTLYALVTGAGSSHGLLNTSNGIIRLNPDGTWTQIADLSTFYRTHPVVNPDPDDFEPDGTPYSMVVVGDAFYVAQSNHEVIDKVTLDGKVERLIDISALHAPGEWIGPTSFVFSNGNFYVGTLGEFPVTPGTEKIFQVSPTGDIQTAVSGLTAVLGVAFDQAGQLYVLETSTEAGNPTPFTGKVVRVTASGALEDLATGLAFPTAMTLGPDGNLYVSNFGFGFPAGMGQVVRIDISAPSGAAAAPGRTLAGLPDVPAALLSRSGWSEIDSIRQLPAWSPDPLLDALARPMILSASASLAALGERDFGAASSPQEAHQHQRAVNGQPVAAMEMNSSLAAKELAWEEFLDWRALSS